MAVVDDGRPRTRLRPSGPRWRRLVAEVRARRGLCCRCQQPIDYTLAYPDPRAFSVDHFPMAWSVRPDLAEDPANLAPAHLNCNIAAQADGAGPGLGKPSEVW